MVNHNASDVSFFWLDGLLGVWESNTRTNWWWWTRARVVITRARWHFWNLIYISHIWLKFQNDSGYNLRQVVSAEKHGAEISLVLCGLAKCVANIGRLCQSWRMGWSLWWQMWICRFWYPGYTCTACWEQETYLYLTKRNRETGIFPLVALEDISWFLGGYPILDKVFCTTIMFDEK